MIDEFHVVAHVSMRSVSIDSVLANTSYFTPDLLSIITCHHDRYSSQ
jgi:hypothetical protein